jgi:hypothetical protein
MTGQCSPLSAAIQYLGKLSIHGGRIEVQGVQVEEKLLYWRVMELFWDTGEDISSLVNQGQILILFIGLTQEVV